MSDSYDRDAVLAKTEERRRIAAELAADLPQESALDLVRRRLAEQRARQAEKAGQLDFGTASDR